VNGKVVIAKSEANNGTGVIGNRFKSINPEDGYIFYCEGQFIKENHYETIVLSIEQLSDTGSFVLKTRTGEDHNQGQYRIGENSAINKVYVTTNQYRGKVHVIKLDTINQIISGRFFFTGEYFFGTDTVQIT